MTVQNEKRVLVSFKDVVLAWYEGGFEAAKAKNASKGSLEKARDVLAGHGQDVKALTAYITEVYGSTSSGKGGSRGRSAPKTGETRPYTVGKNGTVVPCGTLGSNAKDSVNVHFGEDENGAFITLRRGTPAVVALSNSEMEELVS